MRRRAFLTGVILATTGPCSAALAEQPGKVWRIGQVVAGGGASRSPLLPLLRDHLAQIDLVEGRDIAVLDRAIPPQPKEAEDALRAFIPQIDLLAVWSTIGAVAAKKVATDIPVVFLSVGDPVRIGLVQSLAHPGGNMTGITFEATMVTYGKRLQVLKEIIPGLTHVGVLRTAGDINVDPAVASLEESARQMNIILLSVDFAGPQDLEPAFVTMKERGAEAVVVVAGAQTFAHRERIAALALANRLPSSHGFRETVAAGGLVSIGPHFGEMARQGAVMIRKIINGASPATIPVEQPTRYTLALNLSTARTLGLSISDVLVAQADEVIE